MTYFKGLARDVWQMIVPDFEARKRRKQDEQAFRETVVAETGFTEAGEIMVRIVRAVSKLDITLKHQDPDPELPIPTHLRIDRDRPGRYIVIWPAVAGLSIKKAEQLLDSELKKAGAFRVGFLGYREGVAVFHINLTP